MGGVDRVLSHQNEGQEIKRPDFLNDWLDLLQRDREQTIARLRSLDYILVKHGRLQQPTLEKRVR